MPIGNVMFREVQSVFLYLLLGYGGWYAELADNYLEKLFLGQV